MGLLGFILVILFFGQGIALAPPLTPRSKTDNPPPSTRETATPSEPLTEESDVEVRRPVVEKVKRATLPAAHTPAKHGQTTGPSWIAQRTIVEDYCGWGWVRKDDQEWNKGRWIAIEASPGLCPIPHTFLPRPEDDQDRGLIGGAPFNLRKASGASIFSATDSACRPRSGFSSSASAAGSCGEFSRSPASSPPPCPRGSPRVARKVRGARGSGSSPASGPSDT